MKKKIYLLSLLMITIIMILLVSCGSLSSSIIENNNSSNTIENDINSNTPNEKFNEFDACSGTLPVKLKVIDTIELADE